MLRERAMEKLNLRLLVINEPAEKYVLALTLFFQ
jgi:hypothetical protein